MEATGTIRTDKHGNITWMNDAFENMTGYSLKEVKNETAWFNFLFGVTTDKVTLSKLKAGARKKILSVEDIIIYHKNRTCKRVQLMMHPESDTSVSNEGWLITFKDLAAEKPEDYRLKLLQTVIDNAFDSIMITEGLSKECGENYRIVYVNNLFEQVTCYSKADVLGKTTSFLAGGETDRITRKMIREKLAEWEPFTAELINYKKNGQKFWNQICFIPVANEKDGYKTWISIQRDITRQKTIDAMKKAQEAEIKKEITRALLIGEDTHRKLMSMELHDNVGQLLTGMKLFLTQFKKNKTEEYLDESIRALDQSIKGVRDLSHSLSIPDESDNALLIHIEGLLKKINATEKIHFSFRYSLDESSLHKELSVNIFRIIQEQINNILKYSKATHAEITLEQENHLLLLSIKDNGIGFNKYDQSMGIGLTNIRTRVNLFNGEMKIITNPGMGCELQISLERE